MSWRTQGGVTGSNNIPLGSRRRLGGEEGGPDAGPEESAPRGDKRGRSPVRRKFFLLYSLGNSSLTSPRAQPRWHSKAT